MKKRQRLKLIKKCWGVAEKKHLISKGVFKKASIYALKHYKKYTRRDLEATCILLGWAFNWHISKEGQPFWNAIDEDMK